MAQYTVIGFWTTADTRHVIGVIEGEHSVTGGVEPNDRGLFAELVEADSAEAAEEQVHGSREEDEDEEEDEDDRA